MAWLVRTFFVLASASLMLLATGLVLYGPVLLVIRLVERESAGAAVLEALGYMILALAVFDVGKYLYDEEITRGREMRQAAETRRSLTRFITIVIVALLMDSLVNVSKAASLGQAQLLYPAALVLAGVALLIGLGVFMRLSATTEEKVGAADEADVAREAAEEAGEDADEARLSALKAGQEARQAGAQAQDAEGAAAEAKAASGA